MNSTPEPEDSPSLDGRVADLESQLKQRETNIFRALRLLQQNYRDPDAWWGVAHSFLVTIFWRRGAIIVVSLVGAIVAITQIMLLIQQNELIGLQNEFIEAQTRANHIEAISSLLSELDPDDADAMEMAMAPFAVFGDEAYVVLIELANPSRSGLPASIARTALVRGAPSHTADQARDVLALLFRGLITEFRNECRELLMATLYTDYQEHLPDKPCSSRDSETDRDLMADAANDISDYINHWAGVGRMPVLEDESVHRSITTIYTLILADRRGKSLNAMLGAGFPKMMYSKNRAWSMGNFDRSVGFLCDSWKGTKVIQGYGLSEPLAAGLKGHQVEISDPDFNKNLKNIADFVVESGAPGLCDSNSPLTLDDVVPQQ